jgi:hypothetical protein
MSELRRKLKPAELVALGAVAVATLWWLAVSSEAKQGQPDSLPGIHAESVVKFKQGTFACISRADFSEAVTHIVAKEKTKLDAMFFAARCMMVPTTESYKVLHVEQDAIEFINAGTSKSEGMWAYREAAEL